MTLDNILGYYEHELAFLRRMGGAFARKYGKIAGQLFLEPDKCDDPHVERLLEGVAFLAARVHHKLDEEFPEITAAFLEAIAPSYLAPLPSFSMARILGKKTAPWRVIPAGTQLHTRPLRDYDLRCRFRTCYPVTLWPAVLGEVRVLLPGEANLPVPAATPAVLLLQLRCTESSFRELLPPGEPPPLRLYLDGEQRFQIYEFLLQSALFDGSTQPLARDQGGGHHSLVMRPVGFESDEMLLPNPQRSFLGYRCLQEYFAFKEKHLFFELAGLTRGLLEKCDKQLSIYIPLSRPVPPELHFDVEDFLLGCTPVVNLFPVLAEPITLHHQRTEYRVIPDTRRQDAFEIYSIDDVFVANGSRREAERVEPLWKSRGAIAEGSRSRRLYTMSRRMGKEGTDSYLSLLDPSLADSSPAPGTLLVHTTCSNRDLASQLPIGTSRRRRLPDGQLESEKSCPGDFWPSEAESEAIEAIDCLVRPTPVQQPPSDRSAHWRLISHLSVNYLSLCSGNDALAALKEILSLYGHARPGGTVQEIAGLRSLNVTPAVRRIVGPNPGMCRGLDLLMELDDELFVGGSAAMFAAVLDRFFGMYVSINSFTALRFQTRRDPEPRRFPARSGQKALL